MWERASRRQAARARGPGRGPSPDDTVVECDVLRAGFVIPVRNGGAQRFVVRRFQAREQGASKGECPAHHTDECLHRDLVRRRSRQPDQPPQGRLAPPQQPADRERGQQVPQQHGQRRQQAMRERGVGGGRAPARATGRAGACRRGHPGGGGGVEAARAENPARLRAVHPAAAEPAGHMPGKGFGRPVGQPAATGAASSACPASCAPRHGGHRKLAPGEQGMQGELPDGKTGGDPRQRALPPGQGCGDREHHGRRHTQRPPRDGGARGDDVPARGQHDTDRGEDRGPQQPKIGGCARCGGGRWSHGRAIIPLVRPVAYGRARRGGALPGVQGARRGARQRIAGASPTPMRSLFASAE